LPSGIPDLPILEQDSFQIGIEGKRFSGLHDGKIQMKKGGDPRFSTQGSHLRGVGWLYLPGGSIEGTPFY